ncbi:uncharacterized protein LOC124253304 [Haliotis rubra]|uniref:uncharacterized protein LOC124253304 n=1 Tax=Haliotis rubra TaxID=36100 RepID=UPI001EE5F71A|nr:uncharacterized protein LOC124253304 [Haliotis rubra]
MIDQLGIGTQIDNNVLKSAQDTFTSERKSRVRLDSESEKQVMVEDHSQQHSHQAVTDVAKDASTEDATDSAIEAATDAPTEAATYATTDDATDHAIESGNGGQYSDNIQPSLVSALYRSMGIFFRGRNASQLKECLPGLEIREPDINLQSKGLSVGICNAEGESENTKDCVGSRLGHGFRRRCSMFHVYRPQRGNSSCIFR